MKYAIENGIIDLSYIQEEIEMNKRKDILEKHIYKIAQGKDGKWRTYIPDKEKGRKLIKRNTKEDVENVVISYWKKEIENPTVKDIYDEWISGKLDREEISYATKNRYDRQFCECMYEFGKLRIKKIEPYEIEEFILESIYKHSLTRKGFSNLRILIYGIFRRAKKRGLVEYSISEIVQDIELSKKMFRKVQKDDEDLVFMQDEVPKIIKYLCENKKDLINLGILLLFKTGLRPGELAGLEWQDINISQNIIHVCRTEIRYDSNSQKNIYCVRNFPKTEAGIRDVIIPKQSAWIITEIRKQNPFGRYVFEKDGERIRTYQFSQRLETVCKKTNIKSKSLNKIRKTYGTILIDAKVDESIVISQMGHTDIKTTKNYYYKNRRNTSQKADIINQVNGL